MSNSVGAVGHNKKKKKRGFLQEAKKLARRGHYGKGRELSEEEYHYYIRVLEQLKNIEENEKSILIRNFFREFERENDERSLASNQIISRILDDVLPLASVSSVVKLSTVFQDDIRLLCVNPYASHVVQTLLTLSLKYLQVGAVERDDDDDDDDEEEETEGKKKTKTKPVKDEHREQFIIYITKMSKFVFNNLEEFICEVYASHVVRTVLEVCSGIEVSSLIKCSEKAQTSHTLRQEKTDILIVPDDLLLLLKDIIIRLTQIPNLTDIICNNCGSAVLQTALLVASAKDSKLCKVLVKHILQHGVEGLASSTNNQSEESVADIFLDNSSVRLLEVLLSVASSKQQSKIHAMIFNTKMLTLVKHPQANFAVQRLLSSWKQKDTFGDLFEELSDTLEDCMKCGNTGVIWALVQACCRLGSHQSRCSQIVMKLMQCSEPNNYQIQLVPCLLHLLPRGELQGRRATEGLPPPPISLHGALILQQLLKFNKPIKVVSSLLNMTNNELVSMSCNPRGSHVIDAFVDSEFVGEKSREKLVHKFKGVYCTLACSKHGSRSLEALWKVAGLNLRSQICSELMGHEGQMRNNQFGSKIYTNFQVNILKRSGNSNWQDIQEKENKKRQMFDDLIKDDNDIPIKKKKKAKEEDLDGEIFIDTIGDQ